MEEEIVDEVVLSAEEVEFAQTAARYDEVLSSCKLLRARLLMNTASVSGNPVQPLGDPQEITGVVDSLEEMEKQLHHLSTQEAMLEEIKMSKLALELFSGDGPFDGLDDLLKEHCANQAKLFELAKRIKSEKLAQKKSIDQLLDQLCQYTASLKADQEKLGGGSSIEPEDNAELTRLVEKKIKEIRFMQICISQIIATKNIDLREFPAIKRILKSVRQPITSIEHFI